MPLNAQEDAAVQACIEDLLVDHIGMPFGILREYGVVSDLRGRLVATLPLGAVPASIRGEHPYVHAKAPQVYRVQQEIKVSLSHDWVTGHVTFHDKQVEDQWRAKITPGRENDKEVDIAILSTQPTLECKPSGPGDMVARLHAGSVAGAIEVKASPSAQSGLKGDYVKDVLALLDLAHKEGISGYFVLLDKSLGLYGTPQHQQALRWDGQTKQTLNLRGHKLPTITCHSFQDAGIRLARAQAGAEPEHQPSVQVWAIEQVNGTHWKPACYHAYWR